MKYNEVEQIVNKFLAVVGEYVDSCQVIITENDDDGTHMYENGTGNYYSRLGACREFILKSDERTKQMVKEEFGDVEND